MSKNFAEAIVLIALMALPLLAFSPIQSTNQPIHSTRPRVPAPSTAQISTLVKSSGCSLPAAQCLASINWAGYAITNETNSVTFVGASWTVPAIAGAVGATCPDPDKTWLDASFWIGIDGFNNGYVEQTGTSSDCLYGQVRYYPWYEFYPAVSYPLPSADQIAPGDTMYAYVNYTAPKFGIWIQDKGPAHVWHFSLYGTNAGAPRTSAEWITEGAAGCITSDCSLFNFLALTDFKSVTFTDTSATVVCSACVTPGTYTFPVSSPAWGASVYWILVTTVFYPPPAPFIRAIPTTAENGDFTVRWESSGP